MPIFVLHWLVLGLRLWTATDGLWRKSDIHNLTAPCGAKEKVMESKDKQETILPDAMPEKIPMNSWKRSGVFLFVSVLCCTLFLGLLNFGGNDSAQADKANAPCQAPEQVVVRQVKPLGVDRSGCQKLPSNGVAKCYAGEVGVRFGRSENGYRRVYCGGCEKLVYPASKPTTVKLTINGGAQ